MRWKGIENAVRSRRLRSVGPAVQDALAEARSLFGRLPGPYAEYVGLFGCLADGRTEAESARILLGLTTGGDTDARQAARVLRVLHGLPSHWIPIELLPDRQVACVDATSRQGAVSLLDLDDIDAGGVPWAPSLVDFVYEWAADLKAIADTLAHLKEEQRQVDAGTRTRDQLDRPGDWTVSRLCSEDVVLAVLRARHNREHNRHDVSVFATATLTSFAPGATVRAALAAVLSDAYRSGGPLAVTFGTNGEGPVPGPLRRWASQHGINLPHRGGWDAKTGQALYCHAADLTPGTRRLLPVAGVSTAAVCHAVVSGTWAPEAVEAMLRWSPSPQRILAGSVDITDRLNWVVDRQTVRAALIVASAVRVLRRSDGLSEDDDSAISIGTEFAPHQDGRCDPSASPVTLAAASERPLRLPWRCVAGQLPEPARTITLRVLPVENHLLPSQLPALIDDIAHDPGQIVVVPADANTSTDEQLAAALHDAGARGVTVLSAPDYTTTLDVRGEQNVLRARTARS